MVFKGDFLPKDPHHWLNPHGDELPSHEWLPVFQRGAAPVHPSAPTIQHLIRQTLKKAEREGVKVKPDIMTWGSLNADLVLWDGLAYLLEHVKDPHNIHTTLAAIKMVSDNIVAEILDPSQTIKYIHVPDQKHGSTD
ncbi:hypothetical protein RRG08_049700 [Elysia crispata]|uniref:Uncharacterized protein n=1 Tax=Elysia crispata TaxID=231223 RepID=A0AAE1DYL0_9GAST|nr:hypothetical protein RRG08_049700 [Elysia crispata]